MERIYGISATITLIAVDFYILRVEQTFLALHVREHMQSAVQDSYIGVQFIFL